ncbi:hypothetical protein EJB05_24574, partial [Eragrostis curvula]
MAALVVPGVLTVPPAHHHHHHRHFVPAPPPRRPTTTQNHYHAPPSPSSVILVRWTPPYPGCFKLNFDGSVLHDGSGRAGIGGVLRDCTGRILFAFAERTAHAPIGVVEARALIRGLHLVLQSGPCVADKLTKEAYRCPGVWIGRLVPLGVFEKAEDDRHGVVHQRVRPV